MFNRLLHLASGCAKSSGVFDCSSSTGCRSCTCRTETCPRSSPVTKKSPSIVTSIDWIPLRTSVSASGAPLIPVSYTHLRAHETPEHLVCRLLLEKKKKK
eukprot:TRINITY_DN20132_c0_g1_i2.p1 TRINITY_DN20132_c0_g1~~TRINITY_DN20132_c0_g1_i2.p1  ORF type:complete len:100 (+),score=19.21 TRINITY_DN20132_c0_g1_i2:477-776(+)